MSDSDPAIVLLGQTSFPDRQGTAFTLKIDGVPHIVTYALIQGDLNLLRVTHLFETDDKEEGLREIHKEPLRKKVAKALAAKLSDDDLRVQADVG